MPGGRPMPPSMPPIFCLISASTFLNASLQAARIMSWSISTSPATSGSILTARRFFCPSIWTDTMPPPAVASTLISAISCCIFSCMRCACCIICCMLPGSFTGLLLEISNFSNFAAEDFAEALHFGIGEGAAGGIVLLDAGGGRCGDGGSLLAGIADRHFDAVRFGRDLLQRFVQVVGPERQLVGGGRDELQLA